MLDEFQVLWCQGQFALGEVKSKTRGSETQKKKRVDVQWRALFRSQATGGRVHGASLFIGAQQWPRCEKQAMGPSQNKTKSPGLFCLSCHSISVVRAGTNPKHTNNWLRPDFGAFVMGRVSPKAPLF